MSWKKLICFMGIGLLVLCFSSTGFAGDSDKRLEILIQAPIDEVNCQHSTPTIMVLGLPIDVSDAAFTVKGQKSSITCWDISGGLTAAVTLTGDTADEETGLLTATDVEIQTAAENPVKINAPLEAVDASGTTVSVLGLTVDISSAVLLNDFKHPITASQLKADQFARIAITPDSDPLAATKVQVRINQVSVQAPIEAISCDSSPATITLLGLKMDVSKAVFGPRWHKAVVSCSDLEAGQVVEAYLTSDISDSATGLLTATQVDLREGWWFWGRGRGCHYQPVKINAPLQGVDPNTNSVTVLGLPVDAQYAWIFDEQLETVGLSQLKAGQFAKLTLLPDSLTALTILAHVDEVKVKAPVTAIDCDNETITVLGLPVDVTSATFGSKWDWHWGGGKRNCYHRGLTCRSLKVGQTVAVELTGDLSGTYAAKEVEVRGSRDDDVMISGPVDSADPSGKTVTVLGLTIDMSAAKLRDDNGHTITLAQLVPGQFVDIELTSDETPLLAVSLMARTGTNRIQIRLFDEKGKPVAAGSVKATLTVKNGKSLVVREVTAGGGSLILTSIPAGQAKIAITRVYKGKTSKASVSVAMKSDTNKLVNAKLRAVK